MFHKLTVFPKIILIIVALIFLSSCSYKNKLTATGIIVHPYYQSNMVFQQDRPIELNGICSPHGILGIRIENALKLVEADNAGKWKVIFPPIDYKGNFTIFIEGEEEVIKLDNLVTGKIWLVIGDSWLPLEKENIYNNIQTGTSVQNVRYYQPLLNLSDTLVSDFSWKVLNPGKIKEYELFARILGEGLYKIDNIPVGIVNCIWPGTDFINFSPNIPGKFIYPKKSNVDSVWDNYYTEKDIQSEIEDSSFKGIERGVLDIRLNDYDWGELDFPINTGDKWFLKDRVIWFRKRFFVSDKYITGNFQVHFGTIRGSFIFYINGKRVDEFKGEQRNYVLPVADSLLRTWSNLITVRMVTTDSLSGFYSNNLRVVNKDTTFRMDITKGWKYRTYFEPQIKVAKVYEYLYPRIKESLFDAIDITDVDGVIIAGGYPMYKHCGSIRLEEGLKYIHKRFNPQYKFIYLLNKPGYVDSLMYNDLYINKVGEMLLSTATSGYSLINISDVPLSDLNSGEYNTIVQKLSNELTGDE